MSSESELKKAYIEVLEGSLENTKFEVLFNPTEYSVERSNTYKSTSIPGLGSSLVQFINGEARQLSMELMMDTLESGDNLIGLLAKFGRLLDIDSKLHAPSPVRFRWARFEFKAVIEKVTQKTTMFLNDGTPVRATLNVTFREYLTIAEQLIQPRRESADRTKRRQLTADDSLWAMAWREYGSPAEWRLIARANDIDDPRLVQPGTWLSVPPLDTAP
jgi:hypothetical protein